MSNLQLDIASMGTEEQEQESSSMPESAATEEETFFDGDSIAQDEIITLNIGGRLFTTRRQTCLKVYQLLQSCHGSQLRGYWHISGEMEHRLCVWVEHDFRVHCTRLLKEEVAQKLK